MNIEKLKLFLTDITDILVADGEKQCYDMLSGILEEFAEERETYSAEKDKEEYLKFKKEIHPILLESKFSKYIIHKPGGYAGDFVSQELIWFGRTLKGEYKYCGVTERGKLISSLTFDMEACKAYEERIKIIRDLIQNEGNEIASNKIASYKIASIGCGSAIELWDLQDWIDEEDIDIFLLDQDDRALKRAKQKLGQVKNGNVCFHNENILKFILNQDNTILSPRDLIYVAGMTDYFSTENSSRIAKGLWKFVKPGGLLVVTNAHPKTPTRFWMEYGGDWILKYKTEGEMYRVSEGLSSIEDVKVRIDSQGVHQYLKIRKSSN